MTSRARLLCVVDVAVSAGAIDVLSTSGMTLRASLQAEILQLLNSGAFVANDFKLETDPHNRGTKLRISYQYSDAFFFANIPNQISSRTEDQGTFKQKVSYYNIELATRPGTLNIEEKSSAEDDASLLAAIHAWLERLQADLRQAPIARSIEEHEQLIRDLYEKIGLTDETDAPLDEKQHNSIVQWITDLEAKMAENLRQSEKDKKILEKKLAELHSQVEALYHMLQTHLTKKGVVRAIMGRVLAWASKPENQKLLKDAGAAVGGLLGAGEKK